MVMVKPWESTIPHSRPDLGADEADAARGTVAGGHVAQGPVVAAFEAEVAALVGRKYGVATSSRITGHVVDSLQEGVVTDGFLLLF